MDVIEIVFLFLKAAITHCLYFEASPLGQQPLSWGVIDAIVQYILAGALVWNSSFGTLVVGLALVIHIAQQLGKSGAGFPLRLTNKIP